MGLALLVLSVGMVGPILLGPRPAAAQEAEAHHDRIDAIFSEWDRTDSPGCALGVVREGELAYARGYGMANLDWGIPLSSRSVFYMASVSKQFAAASVALAAEQGHLSLDDPVRTHVPELPDYGHGLTVRHLIHHMSGIRDYLGLMRLAGQRWEDVLTDARMMELITGQEALNFPPGTDWLYSNSGYILLGIVAERATGQKLREFSTEHIFRTLEMSSTHFHDDAGHIVERRVVGYSPADDSGFRTHHYWNFDKVGDGGLYSSVRDLFRWDRNFQRRQVGGTGFVDTLLSRGVLDQGDTLSYAFGLRKGEFRGVRTVSHGGSLMGFRHAFVRFPEEAFSAIVLCNLSSIEPNRLALKVAEVYLEERMEPVPEPPQIQREELERWTGSYRSPESRQVRTFEVRDGELVEGDSGENRYLPIAPGRFRPESHYRDQELRFREDSGGRVLEIRSGIGIPETLEEVNLVAPEREALETYAGSYRSRELGATWSLAVREGTLRLDGASRTDVELEPTVQDEFSGPGLVLAFEREEGRIEGFRVFAGGVRGVVFRRE